MMLSTTMNMFTIKRISKRRALFPKRICSNRTPIPISKNVVVPTIHESILKSMPGKENNNSAVHCIVRHLSINRGKGGAGR